MITSEQIKESFISDLKSLLQKYGASIELAEGCTQYQFEKGLDEIVVYCDAKYDDSNECLREFTKINLGRNIPNKNQKLYANSRANFKRQ